MYLAHGVTVIVRVTILVIVGVAVGRDAVELMTETSTPPAVVINAAPTVAAKPTCATRIASEGRLRRRPCAIGENATADGTRSPPISPAWLTQPGTGTATYRLTNGSHVVRSFRGLRRPSTPTSWNGSWNE